MGLTDVSSIKDKEEFLREKGLTRKDISYIFSNLIPEVKPPLMKHLVDSNRLEEEYNYVQEVLLIPVDAHIVLKELARSKEVTILDLIIDILIFETEYSIIDAFKSYEGIL